MKDGPEEVAKTGLGERFPLPIEIRGRSKLLNHRDMICHPTVVKWRNSKNNNQAFADAGHKWVAVRSGLVWDVQKQINEALRTEGSTVYVDDVPATAEMGELLRTVLISAGMALTEHHTGNAFHRHFELQRDNFREELEKYPDGIVDPEVLKGVDGQL